MKNNEEQFKTLASYWCGKLDTPFPIFKRMNKKSKFLGAVSQVNKNNFYFHYNFRVIKYIDFGELIMFILHEIGHVKNRIKGSYVKKEYLAETFALKLMKKYFPKEYKKQVKDWKKSLKNKEWQKMFPDHYKAFKKIREYN